MTKRIMPMLAALAVCLAVTACGESEAASPATSSPTQAPLSDPVTARLETAPRVFLDAIPASERECVVASWGQARYDQIVAGGAPTVEENEAAFDCLGDTTAVRMLLGGLVAGAGELSDTTLRCASQRLAEADPAIVRAAAQNPGGDTPADDLAQAVASGDASILQAVFCLNADERAALEASGGFVMGEDIAAFECLASELGDERFRTVMPDLVQIATVRDSRFGTAAPAGSQAGPPADVLEAMRRCGLAVGGS